VEDTVWLSLDQMAELFQRDKSTISRHIKNVYTEGELKPELTVAKFATVQNEGNRNVERQIEYYNLDVIISVGYRVKSHRGTQFRIWAMNMLKEYMKKGFALDDERLKNLGGGNYFDELLARIRDIRSSEKVFWRITVCKSFFGRSNERSDFMTMTRVEIDIPETITQYVVLNDEESVKIRNAMVLYPYIKKGVISHGKAAELLSMHKLDLIKLYGGMGLVYMDMTDNT